MSRYWLSFLKPTQDYRPLAHPPNEQILGWWCSGYDGNDNAIICALVSAPARSVAEQAVLKEWPDATWLWRFFDERPADWVPGDRFPLADWMRARVAPTVAKNATVAEVANA